MRCIRLFALLLVVAAPVQAVAQSDATAQELTEQRERDRALAAVVSPADVDGPLATDSQILASLGLPASTSPSLVRTGAAAAIEVFPNLGAVRPIRGSTLLAISTGTAGSTFPQPGTDFSPSGTAGDRATLSVTFTVPAGMSRLNFWFRYMSAEFPEYVGSQYNDRLSISAIRNGVREEVSRSSVNSTLFEPATSTNAGGTGYEVSINNRPTGGLTEWLPVVVPVTPGQMSLEFSIEDVGDGIYDSQVVVSSLGLFAIETLDPAGTSLRAGLGLTTDVNLLAREGRPVRGAAADGVTRLLLRAAPPDGTSVRFQVVGGSAADGGLTPVRGGTPQAEVVVDVVGTAAGPRAFAVFHAPEDLHDSTSAERVIRVRATVIGGGGAATESEVVLARPFLVLMHGLWSDPQGAWGGSALYTDPRFAGRVDAYPYDNTGGFNANSPLYRGFVDSALARYRAAGLAGVQVDLLGHSMGGVLARHYAQSSQYRRDDNYQQGDFNRVVSVNSPHRGSPWADLLVTGHLNPLVGGVVDQALASLGMPYGPALEDLREQSGALQAIARADVRGHALTGTGGSDLIEAVGVAGTLADLLSHIPQPPLTQGILRAMVFVADALGTANAALFNGRQHDLIVPLESEIGGMPTARTGSFSGLSSIHTSATRATDYSQRMVTLLNTAPSSASFGSFPARGGNPSSDAVSDVPQVTNVAPPVGLSVSATPTTIGAGGTVRVTVTALSGFTPASVFVAGPGVAIIDDVGPFVVDLTVPSTHIGAFPVNAIARQADGTYIGSNTVTVTVTTPATLTSLAATPGQLLLTAINGTALMEVTGQYSDNVTRSLTRSGLLTFASSDTTVATVSSAGVVTARGIGYAAISAATGGRTVSISAIVNPYAGLPPPRADAGPDQGVTPGSLVTFAGRALDVPSGLTAQFSWAQVAGPVTVSLSNAATAAPTFTASTAGTYVFSLIVRAGLAESNPDNVTVVVGAAAAPIIQIPPASITVRQGETAALSVVATGIPTPTFQWIKDGAPVAGATSSTLTMPNAQPINGGMFTVTVSNASGTLTAGPASVTVCSFAASASTIAVDGAGGSGTIALTTTPGCAWTATSDAAWLTVPSGGSGSGSAVLTWSAAASQLPTSRSATLAIGGAVLSVTQAPGVILRVPAAPENLVASQNGPAVTMSWDAPAIGPAPLGYVIEIGTTPGGNELAPRATGSTSTTHVFTISSGAYYVRVRGYSSDGQSDASNEVRVSFGGAAAPPAGPVNLRADVDGSSVSLRWSPSAAGHAPTGFVLEAGTGLNLSNLVVLDTGTTLPVFSTTNVPAGQYFVRVRSQNSAGSSAPSNEVSLQVGQTACTGTPAAPILLSPNLQGSIVSLSWLPPSGGVRSFVLLAGSQPGQADIATFDTGSSTTSYGTPVPAGTYFVRVVARTACADSAPSNEVSFTVGLPPVAPGRAVGLSATLGAGGLLLLNWYPPALGGPPEDYLVEAGSTSGAADLAVVSSGSTATTFSTAGVPPGRYYIRVKARNAAGVGLPSNELVLNVP